MAAASTAARSARTGTSASSDTTACPDSPHGWRRHGATAPRFDPAERLGSCVARPSKIICIGLNYRAACQGDRCAGADRADHLPQVHHRALRSERRRDDSARLAEDRLGGGARRRDRQHGALRERSRRDVPRGRLRAAQRLQRARLSRWSAAASGSRERAATPSRRSVRSWPPRDEIADPHALRALAHRQRRDGCRTATPNDLIFNVPHDRLATSRSS